MGGRERGRRDADEGDEGAEEQERGPRQVPPPKKDNKNLMMIGGAAALVLIVILALAMGGGEGKESKGKSGTTSKKKKKKKDFTSYFENAKRLKADGDKCFQIATQADKGGEMSMDERDFIVGNYENAEKNYTQAMAILSDVQGMEGGKDQMPMDLSPDAIGNSLKTAKERLKLLRQQ